MRFAFHQRVAVVSSRGDHIRYVHSAMATALVSGGAAQQPDPTGGRVRSITLACSPVLQRIGEPTGSSFGGVKFTRWKRLDESAVRIIEHHPRCLY
jgi:hypothetical protein